MKLYHGLLIWLYANLCLTLGVFAFYAFEGGLLNDFKGDGFGASVLLIVIGWSATLPSAIALLISFGLYINANKHNFSFKKISWFVYAVVFIINLIYCFVTLVMQQKSNEFLLVYIFTLMAGLLAATLVLHKIKKNLQVQIPEDFLHKQTIDNYTLNQ
jgi:uncharacterized membrane protein